MAHNEDIRHGRDRPRRCVHQDHAFGQRSKNFDVTPEQLKEAVRAVGDEANRVEALLVGSLSKTNGDRVQDA